ncbi:hypothetical protein [Thalassospira sp.]|uniref:hypothetical protein n=1 Tax=Thalassospira sp. TaxID=1912094 RepID=UPI001B26D344|nr:hypothetical protein [Thalassospira sp.]MBO6805960.1 hypothetical protein [Thalassospira sp.]
MSEQMRKALIVLSDNSRVDLEWILPLVVEMKQQGIVPVVFDVTDQSRVSKHNFWSKALRVILGQDCILLADLEPIPKKITRVLVRLRASTNRFVSIWSAIYFSWKSPLYRFRLLKRWREQSLADAWKSCFENVEVVYIGLRDVEYPEGTGEKQIVEIAKQNNIPIVGYPPVVDSEIPLKSMMDLDLVLSNTVEQAGEWSKVTKNRILPITPPKYTNDWLKYLPLLEEDVLGRADFFQKNRNNVLLVLKNDNSIVWDDIDFYETSSALLEYLVGGGNFVLIKFHPRQSEFAKTKLLSQFSVDDYRIVDGPLINLARKADRVVSLFSGGVLDCLAAGKVAVLYWPINSSYKKKIKDGNVSDVYIRFDDDGRIFTKFYEFVQEVTSKEFFFPEDVGKDSRQFQAFEKIYDIKDNNYTLHEIVRDLYVRKRQNERGD